MRIITKKIKVSTKGNPDFVNITDELSRQLLASKCTAGNLTVFVIGSTAGITTFEYEPGLIQDMEEAYERIAPGAKTYHHDATWGDANGFSHVRAAFSGPDLTIPFEEGKLLLGTWQQVVLTEFDNRPRQRQIIIHIIGE